VLRYLGSHFLLNVAIVLTASIAYFLSDRNVIFQCVVCFYVGGMSAILSGTRIAHAHRTLLLWLSSALLVILPAALLPFDIAVPKAAIQFLGIVYIAVLLHVMAEHLHIPQRFEGPVRTAGNMTYSSYLVHFPLQLAIAIVCAALGVKIPTLSVVFFVCYIATVLLLAVVLYRFFEVPGQRFLRTSLSPACRAA